MDYFIRAGEEFCQSTPFTFHAPSYAKNVAGVLTDPEAIAIVFGEPVTGHCVAKLSRNLYNDSEIIARIVTTWGNGGLKCYREVRRQAKKIGANFIRADVYIEPRMAKVYERDGMVLTDGVYTGKL